jgi:TonB family protein
MRVRVLNIVSFISGAGFTLGIFFAISYFLRAQEKTGTASVAQDDLEIVPVVMPPPPPVPKVEDKQILIPEMTAAVALGFQEEASSSPVKITPSPPSFEQALPPSHLPPSALAGVTGLDSKLEPQLSLSFDDSHIFQKNEVDKAPVVISRPVPDVPESLLGASRARSVVILFVVDTHGVVGKVRILRTSGNAEFDSIIADGVVQWTFSPAIRRGKPVRCMIQQQVNVKIGRRDIFSL